MLLEVTLAVAPLGYWAVTVSCPVAPIVPPPYVVMHYPGVGPVYVSPPVPAPEAPPPGEVNPLR